MHFTFRGVALLAACALSCGRFIPAVDFGPRACEPGSWPTAATVGLRGSAPALEIMAEASYHTTHAGQVFDGVELQGRLYVDHPDVVIRNSRLVGDVYYAVYATAHGARLTIEDSEILGGVLMPDGFVGRRNHLHAAAGAFKNDGWIFAASNVLLEDNLIDGLVGDPGAHLDGIQVMAGNDIRIRHNWIEAISPPIPGGGVNAAVFFGPYAPAGDISNVLVECNMLIEEEGYYPLRIDALGAVVVRGNRWRRGHLGSPVHVSERTRVTGWEDNAYEDGEMIDAP